MTTRRTFLALGSALYVGAAAAQNSTWPDRAQRWVVPFTPGGVLDVLARTIAESLAASSGQQIIIENMPGASGNLGIQAVARAPGDGSTWLFIPQGNITINATLMPNTSFQWGRDFKPVTLLAYAPNVMVVHPSVPAKNVSELIALAKSQPGKLSYGSPGIGSSLHLIGELLKRDAQIDLSHIPYKGTPQALNDLAGGHVQVMFGAIPTLLPMIRSGKVRALAVTTAKRADALPELPTMQEQGISMDIPSWYGLMASAAVPQATIDKAYQAMVMTLNQMQVKERLLGQGLIPVVNRPQEFAAQIQRETAVWARVIREANIKAE